MATITGIRMEKVLEVLGRNEKMTKLSINKSGFDTFIIEDNNGKELLVTDSTGIEYIHEQMRFSLKKKCVEDLEEEINKQNNYITELQEENCKLEDDNDALTDNLQVTETQNECLIKKIKEVREDNKELVAKITFLKGELESLHEEKTALLNKVARLLEHNIKLLENRKVVKVC